MGLAEVDGIWTAKCASLGRRFFRSQFCTLSRSKICPVPPVQCKRKVEPCKFLSAQKFVRTRVNGAHIFMVSTNAFQSTSLFWDQPIGSSIFLSVYKPHTTHNSSIRPDEGLTLETSAWRRLNRIINPVDKTKLYWRRSKLNRPFPINEIPLKRGK